MHSGAMGKTRIFSPEYEEFLVPHSLHTNLLSKAKVNLANNTSIIRQYRKKQRPIDRHILEEELYDHLTGLTERSLQFCNTRSAGNNTSSNNNSLPSGGPHRPRADSIVRFADEELGITNGVGGGDANGGYHGSARVSGTRFGGAAHLRSLTPLSDASCSQRTNLSDITMDRPTPQSIGGGTSGIRKSFEQVERPSVGCRPPPIPPKPDVAVDSSVRNVSNVSLERWLQGSIDGSPKSIRTDLKMTPTDDDDKKDDSVPLSTPSSEKEESSRTSTPTSFPDKLLRTHDDIGDNKTSKKRPPPREVVTNWLTSKVTRSPGSPFDEEVIKRRGESESDASQGRLTASSTFDDRELSEDERFAMDYGDFDDNLDGASPPMISGNYIYSSRYSRNENQVDRLDNDERSIIKDNNNKDDDMDDEKTGLLGSYRSKAPNNSYSTTSTPPISKPPPQHFFDIENNN